MTNQEWLDSLNPIQLRVVANCWAIPMADSETLKAALVNFEDLQITPTNRADIYTERLLKYWSPSLKGRIPNAQFEASCTNEKCNDLIDIDANIENGIFTELECLTQGCCLSECTASILMEYFRGKTVDEALAFTRENMLDLVGIQITKAREACVLLSLECLRKICGQAKNS